MPRADVTIFNVSADEPGGTDVIVQLTGAAALAKATAVTAASQANDTIVTLTGGTAAADEIAEGAAKLDVLVLNLNPDIVPTTSVPGGMMSGPDTVAALKALNPDLQIFDYHIVQEHGNSAGAWDTCCYGFARQ